MRNPARKALYCFFLVLTSAGLIRFGAGRYETVGEGWGSTGPIMLGLALLPFPLYMLIEALFAMRGQAKLLAGIGVIARWQVDPLEWERFRGLDDRRTTDRFPVPNDMWIRKAVPFGPVEVIVGEKSAMIDGSYHSLRPGGIPELHGVSWIEGPPTCLEFRLLYPRGRYGAKVATSLRLPVPSSARTSAVRVFEHFERLTRRSPALALRNPRRTYWICAILVLGAALSATAGYALARALPDGADPLLPLGLLLGGTILAAFAAILALATFLLTRRA